MGDDAAWLAQFCAWQLKLVKKTCGFIGGRPTGRVSTCPIRSCKTALADKRMALPIPSASSSSYRSGLANAATEVEIEAAPTVAGDHRLEHRPRSACAG